ncbi:MAG: MerR family transcriptional regulator [Candidatus Dadabacteria bacterium]|nr:MAG: MerR family transcriptional regulator [Candidatus Dadabacteria bacterium]
MDKAVRLIRVRELVETTGVSASTLRVYREAGLIEPAARQGRAYLYDEDTIETVRRIQRLRNDLGVNLAGIQVILEMRRTIEELQEHLDEVVRFVREDLRAELERVLRQREKAMIPRAFFRPPKPQG